MSILAAEVVGDVISGRNVKIIEGYVVMNCEADSSSSFRDNPKRSYCRHWFPVAVQTAYEATFNF